MTALIGPSVCVRATSPMGTFHAAGVDPHTLSAHATDDDAHTAATIPIPTMLRVIMRVCLPYAGAAMAPRTGHLHGVVHRGKHGKLGAGSAASSETEFRS